MGTQNEFIDLFAGATNNSLDALIETVAHPAGQIQAPRCARCPVTIANALYLTCNS